MASMLPTDSQSVFSLAAECEQLFSRACLELNEAEVDHVHLVEEYQQRFFEWATYSGAFDWRDGSCDYSLSYGHATKEFVVRLLDVLRLHLLQVIDSIPVSPSGAGAISPVESALLAIEQAIDRLGRLSPGIELIVPASAQETSLLPSSHEPGETTGRKVASAIIRSLYPDAATRLQEYLSESLAARCHDIEARRASRCSTSSKDPLRASDHGHTACECCFEILEPKHARGINLR
jgi:hypothetical protein